jgi:HK97 family phage portal protein
VRTIGLWEYIRGTREDPLFEEMFEEELNLFMQAKKNTYMKKLAVDTCVSFLARTISQSTFNVKDGKTYVKDTLHYKLNVRPNLNQTAVTFWEDVVHKLIYDNEALIVKTDTDDLVIADSFTQNEFALYEDIFSDVTVGDYTYTRTFKQSEVIHLRYRNIKLMGLIQGLADDYADMFTALMKAQIRKSQIRALIKIGARVSTARDGREKIQNFINKVYSAVGTNTDVALIPQQEGYEYDEKNSGNVGNGQSFDEVNKVTNGFFDRVAMLIGIPSSLIYGNMADVEKQTKNYIRFTIKPLLKKIEAEINAKFFTEEEYQRGEKLEVSPVSYYDVIEIASAIDKLMSSGFAKGNEVRRAVGWEDSDDPNLEKHLLTKNYAIMDESGTLEGGDEDAKENQS